MLLRDGESLRSGAGGQRRNALVTGEAVACPVLAIKAYSGDVKPLCQLAQNIVRSDRRPIVRRERQLVRKEEQPRTIQPARPPDLQ